MSLKKPIFVIFRTQITFKRIVHSNSIANFKYVIVYVGCYCAEDIITHTVKLLIYYNLLIFKYIQ